MEQVIQYSVLAVVSIIFFIVCYKCFGPTKKAEPVKRVQIEPLTKEEEREFIDYAAMYYEAEKMAARMPNDEVKRNLEECEKTQRISKTEVLKQSAVMISNLQEPVKKTDEEQVNEVKPCPEPVALVDEQKMIDVIETPKIDNAVISSNNTEIIEKLDQEKAIKNKHRQKIVNELMDLLGVETEEAKADLLKINSVKIAYELMQHAYEENPTEWMKNIALACFVQIAKSSKRKPNYLYAQECLKVLAELEIGQVQVLALLLQMEAKPDETNYSLAAFKDFAEKNIEPFMTKVPFDNETYKRLLDLGMVETVKNTQRYNQWIAERYPLVLQYEGFDIASIRKMIGEDILPDEVLVPSLYDEAWKLPVINMNQFDKLLQTVGIEQIAIQQGLRWLVKSQPVSFDGKIAQDVLHSISPKLARWAQIYDGTCVHSMKLTCVGAYLARLHMELAIGQAPKNK